MQTEHMSSVRKGWRDLDELAPGMTDAIAAIGDVVKASGLDKELTELVKIRASQLNGCGYCVSHTGAAGRRAGIPKEQLEALADYRTSPLFSELERLVIGYAETMTTEVQVDGALVETLRERLGPEALVQLTLTVAAANFTHRFNEALGTELEREETRDA